MVFKREPIRGISNKQNLLASKVQITMIDANDPTPASKDWRDGEKKTSVIKDFDSNQMQVDFSEANSKQDSS